MTRARSIRGLTAWFPWLVLTAGLWPASLAGHELAAPKADHLRVSPGKVRLETRYDLEAGIRSEELRGYFDADRDRRLDAGEKARLLAYLRLAATSFLKVVADGAPVKLAVVEERASPLEVPLPSGRSIQSTFILEGVMPAGEVMPVGKALERGTGGRIRRVVLEDRHKEGRIPLPVSVGAEGGCRLVGGRVRGAAGERSIRLPLPASEPVLRGPMLLPGERLELEIDCPRGP